MLRRNGPVVKSVESVLRLEGSLWGERFVEEVAQVHTLSTMTKTDINHCAQHEELLPQCMDTTSGTATTPIANNHRGYSRTTNLHLSSGISWTICKSIIYKPDALPNAQPTVSKH